MPVIARAMYDDGFKALLANANANDLINGIHLAKIAVEKYLGNVWFEEKRRKERREMKRNGEKREEKNCETKFNCLV